jgi:hypothetical protein
LCIKYGFCLSPLWRARLSKNPPQAVRKFTDTVFRAIIAISIAAALAQAQIEQTRESHTLPNADFTWRWGTAVEDAGRDSAEFQARGFEAEFECQLTGRLLARSQGPYQRIEARAFAEAVKDLRLSMFFIWDAMAMMNGYRRDLDWATLVCTMRDIRSERPPRRRADERQKMQRELERRRKEAAEADD